MSDRKGKILTVCGLIEPQQLGVTLTHEHLMLQADGFFTPPTSAGDESKVQMPFTMDNLGWIRQNPYSYKPNLNFLKEEESVLEEMKAYKALGGQGIVENSTIGLHRDVQFLQGLSNTTGVHVVAGTGFYVDQFQSESTRQLSEEAMAARIRDDICSGADGTEICCGVIGEIGCAWPLSDFEKRSLRSAAAVQSELGAPAIIHPGRDPKAPDEIMRIFLEAGARADKTVMSHLDRTFYDTDQLLEFAGVGCYCEYDLFGIETSHYQLWQAVDMPSDAQRIGFIKCLLDNKHSSKILIAHDIHTKHRLRFTAIRCLLDNKHSSRFLIARDIHTKHRLKKYGGHGYTHIFENIVPKMKDRGIQEEDIKKILTDNPAKWLTFVN